MTVYVEYIFINNTVINFAVVFFVTLVLKEDYKLGRLLLSAGIGGIFAVLYPFIDNFNFAIKIFVSVIMTLCGFKNKNIRMLLRHYVVFLGITFVLGGATLMLNYMGVVDLNQISANELTPSWVGGGILLGLSIILSIKKELYKRKKETKFIYNVKINESKDSYIAYYDTGNKLSENNMPIAIIDAALAKRLNLQATDAIRVNTVNGATLMPSVKLKLDVYFESGVHKVYVTKACLTDSLANKAYKVILNRDMAV